MIRIDAEVGGAWPRWLCVDGLLGGLWRSGTGAAGKSKSFKELGSPHGPAAASLSTIPERAAGQRALHIHPLKINSTLIASRADAASPTFQGAFFIPKV